MLNVAHEPQNAPNSITAVGDSRRLQRWIVGAGALLIALIVGADGYEAWLDYGNAQQLAERTQLATARSIAEQTARMFQELDVVLSDYARWRGAGDGATVDARTAETRLNADLARFPFIHSLTLFDDDGRVFASTQDAAAPATIGHRFLDVLTHAPDDMLLIGRAITRDDYRTFSVGRPVHDSQGRVTGTVVAHIAFEYLAGYYSKISVAQDSSIRLLRNDGAVLASFPVDPQPSSIAITSSAPESVTIERDTSDETQLRARSQVQGYPLLVDVMEPMTGVMRAWREEELSSGLRTMSLALLAGGLLAALRTVLGRRDRLEEERRRLERGLRDTQRAEAVGFLAASMAHDFNNVLSAIVGYAEIARAQVGDTGVPARALDGLLGASERAQQLVHRVLTFDLHRTVNRAALDVRPIVVEVLEQLRPGLPAGVTLQVPSEESVALVCGDPTEVHQVIMNLCTNALRAMPGGGRLSARIDAPDIDGARPLTFGSLQPGAWVRVEIADTGRGIAPGQLASIFDSFYTTRGSSEIGGIGLTVVRNIVSSMSGAIEIESVEGVGTAVRVYWPRLEQRDSQPAQEHATVSGHGQSVLVVDDEPELVKLAEEIVASLGYEAIGFGDSPAALESFRRTPQRFDAVITDERMPGMRGTALATAIHAVRPDIPVVLVTGCRDSLVCERAKQAGIDIILDKPVRARHLHEALGRALGVTP